ncbi:MAG: class I tRNA ligase family protein, partial [Peptococcaceae bacterium]|nr:class I tRNA ligase family protein [Peptococcaceae bacterium]
GFVKSIESPTMWDVTFQSAVAQAEIEDKEIAGHFHDINFKIEGTDEHITIATTRPEFLPACIAIVAHPEDERYQKYFGKKAITPLFNAPVDIVASEHAEKDKGTGIMMVCTFGDAADVAWWKTSGLPLRQIIGRDGCMLNVEFGKGAFESLDCEKANQVYSCVAGLGTKQAREKIVAMLRDEGCLSCEPRPITHMVKFYEKGNRPIEFVTSRQWFVQLQDKKDELLAAGRKIKWKPQHMQTRYEEWVKGHRIRGFIMLYFKSYLPTLEKYSFVVFTTIPLRPMIPIKFGIAIRPLDVSEIAQIKSRFADPLAHPMNTTSVYRIR